MSHPDENSLLEVFLGESPDPQARAHLDGCAECQAVLASFQRVSGATRAAADGVVSTVQPPPEVWDRIAGELGLSAPPDGKRPVPAPAVARQRSRWTAAVAGFAVGI